MDPVPGRRSWTAVVTTWGEGTTVVQKQDEGCAAAASTSRTAGGGRGRGRGEPDPTEAPRLLANPVQYY